MKDSMTNAENKIKSSADIRWIFCSERLPDENDKEYLCLIKFDCNLWCNIFKYYNGWNCSANYKGSEIHDVIAWTELPKYPKRIEEESVSLIKRVINIMKDSISRCELFNKLAVLKAPPEANHYSAEVYGVITNMESVEPYLLDDGTLCITTDDFKKVKRVLVQDNHHNGCLFYSD